MGKIFKLRHINGYSESKTGWDLYSLLFDPIPVLALRNLNDYMESRHIHSTLTWLDRDKKRTNNRKRFEQAIHLACSCVQLWRGTRGKRFAPLLKRCRRDLPSIVKEFIARTKEMKVKRISDLLPGDKRYGKLLIAVAEAVNQVARLKGPDNPMFGSKVLHFLIPEFFPVWDNEFIDVKCLAKERIPSLPANVEAVLISAASKKYATYVHLMLTDLSKTRQSEYTIIEKTFLERVLGRKNYNYVKKLADWHYDDLSATIFEVCLLGKWV